MGCTRNKGRVRYLMGNFEVIDWTEESIQEYIKDKNVERTPNYKELYQISKFIRENKFKNIFDLGTWTGITGYIMATSCESVEKLIALDWGEWYAKNVKFKDLEEEKKVYGKYLPKGSIYVDSDFRIKMSPLLKEHNIEFVFIDDGHGLKAVNEQLKICYDNNVKYLAVHDVSVGRMPRRAVYKFIRLNKYKKLFEDLESSPTQGIIFLERVND